MPEDKCKCPWEHEIGRIAKIVDGNGQEGLVRDCKEIKIKMETMCDDIKTLCETSEAQAKSISAFNQYQASQEILTDYKRRTRRERRQLIMFMVAQSLALIGLVVTIILTLIGGK